MAEKIPPICNYLLRTSPDIVEKLPRNDNLVITKRNKESRLVMFGKSENSQIGNIKIIVPEGIAVYRVVKKVRNSADLVFAAREENDMGRAYLFKLSNIQSFCEVGFGTEKNIASLLYQTWYTHEKSSDVWARLLGSTPNTNMYLKPSEEYNPLSCHPLLEKR